jgi:hypothetical protein
MEPNGSIGQMNAGSPLPFILFGGWQWAEHLLSEMRMEDTTKLSVA